MANVHIGVSLTPYFRNVLVVKRKTFLSRELRHSLFYLFANWSGKYGSTFGALDKRYIQKYLISSTAEFTKVVV